MPKMRKDKKEAYIKSGGENCPYCKSDNITGGSIFEVDSGHTWQPMFCNDCERSWKDIYELVDVEAVAE